VLNRTITIDTSPALIDYSQDTPQNGANLSQSNVYINITLIEMNEANITFFLFNTTDLINSTTLLSGNRSVNFTGLIDGDYYFNVTLTDLVGYKNSTQTRKINLDTIYPMVFLEYPENGRGDNDGNITFTYNVTQGLIENCTLVVNSQSNQTNATITNGTTQIFTLSNLDSGSYSWSVQCSDFAGNTNNSETRNIDVIPTLTFTGLTTNFSEVYTYNITNLTLEKIQYGRITFNQNINLSGGTDIDSIVHIENNLVGIDSNTEPRLNTSATITIYNLSYLANPLILRNSLPCTGGICTFNYYNGNLSFNVSYFTNYSSSQNSNLTIWDETDPIIGETKYENNDVIFYSNYTNLTSGESINGSNVYCNISFNIAGWTPEVNMTFNSSSKLYEYNRSFLNNGTVQWRTSCFDSSLSFEPLIVTDTVNISQDDTFPLIEYTTGTQPNGINISRNHILINVSITEDNFANITYELHNLTDLVNRSFFQTMVNSTNFTNLPDTTYFYNVTVSDLASNYNWTETRSLTLDITAPNGSLLQPGNGTLTSNQSINLTANISDTIGLSNATLIVYNSTSDLINQTTTQVSGTEAIVGIVYTFLYDDIFSWFFNVVDLAGNLFTTGNNTIIVDTTESLIQYGNSTEDSGNYYARDWIYVNLTLDEINFANITYELHNSTDPVNSSLYTTEVLQLNWTGLPDEIYFYNVTVVDLASNTNYTETRNITLDTLNPSLMIYTPENITYTTDQLELNFSVSDTNLVFCISYILGGVNH
jgi:hypothetical protein